MEEITLYQAIKEMRLLSLQGKYFSLVHATYNRDTRKTDGVREVKKALLRPAAKEDDISNSRFKLFYYDHYYQENRNCWQPLIMFFNGKKVILI